jgi:excinuclease UvrABC nuclease subunit
MAENSSTLVEIEVIKTSSGPTGASIAKSLEAELIEKHQPPWNVQGRRNKKP